MGMSDGEMTEYSKRQWDALADAGVVCSRPILDMTRERACAMVDDQGLLGDIQGLKALCLAQGGGQQSVAFALLGADVTVFDQSEKQLPRDREAAAHYGFEIRAVQGDIRDLSVFGNEEFDVVSQGYSINYIPEVAGVFDEVTRVLRPGGKYALDCHNPFVHGSWIDGCWGSKWRKEDLWRGHGYPIRLPYVEGAKITTCDPYWHFMDADGNEKRVSSPQEFRHLLSTIMNGLIQRGLMIVGFFDEQDGSPEAEVGSWDHYVSFAPPWLTIWAQKKE